MKSHVGRAAFIVFMTTWSVMPCEAGSKSAKSERVIVRVSLSRASMNLSAGETSSLHVSLTRPALLDVQVIDRDGFVVRTLPPANATAGVNSFAWDGRDARGAVVPDEAYSFRVVADGGADEYFPAAAAGTMIAIDALSYSRLTATLSYMLKAPSRVHVQAGTVRAGAEGPVLKTVIDRQPRDAGKIAEHWSGFDESGSLYIPDLPGFAIAIAATPLPENSVITYGNAKQPFLDYAAHRAGHSLFRHHAHGAHHVGLDVFNDVAPRLTAIPQRSVLRSNEHLWSIADPVAHLQLHASGPTAAAFLRHPGKIFVFLDSKLVATKDARKGVDVLDILLPAKSEHVIVVNWRSDYGPVAVAVTRVGRDGERQTTQAGSRR